jgi:DNA-binding protein YbaB
VAAKESAMFDKLKAMGTMAALLKDKDRIREIGARIKARADETRARGEAGGGAVRVTVSGRMQVLDVELAPALVSGMAADERTRALAGSLIADAVNSAIATSQVMMKSVLEKESRELGLGDLGEQLGGFLQ